MVSGDAPPGLQRMRRRPRPGLSRAGWAPPPCQSPPAPKTPAQLPQLRRQSRSAPRTCGMQAAAARPPCCGRRPAAWRRCRTFRAPCPGTPSPAPIAAEAAAATAAPPPTPRPPPAPGRPPGRRCLVAGGARGRRTAARHHPPQAPPSHQGSTLSPPRSWASPLRQDLLRPLSGAANSRA